MENQEINLNVDVVTINSTDLKQPSFLDLSQTAEPRILGAEISSTSTDNYFTMLVFFVLFIFVSFFVKFINQRIKHN